jgi:hypothetical protein
MFRCALEQVCARNIAAIICYAMQCTTFYKRFHNTGCTVASATCVHLFAISKVCLLALAIVVLLLVVVAVRGCSSSSEC